MKSGKIYGLINPTTNKMFYVGCTQQLLKKRLKSHTSNGKINPGHSNVTAYVSNLLLAGIRPEIKLLEIIRVPNRENISVNQAERKWINHLLKKGIELTNKNNVSKQVA